MLTNTRVRRGLASAPMHFRRSGALVSACLALLVAAGACSSGGSGAGTAGDGDDDPDDEREAPAPEQFTGSVDDFYVVPDPLPAGEPGDLIRVQPLDGVAAGETGLRIMYHSTDAEGDDRAVTGVVYHPDAAPARGRLAGAGVGPRHVRPRVPVRTEPPAAGRRAPTASRACAWPPTTSASAPRASSTRTCRPRPRATRSSTRCGPSAQIPEASAGDRWLLVGHSQGGHAALVTGEMAAERLPDHELLGTVAIAPGRPARRDPRRRHPGPHHHVDGAVRRARPRTRRSTPPTTSARPPTRRRRASSRRAASARSSTRWCRSPSRPTSTCATRSTTSLGDEWLAANDPGQVVVGQPDPADLGRARRHRRPRPHAGAVRAALRARAGRRVPRPARRRPRDRALDGRRPHQRLAGRPTRRRTGPRHLRAGERLIRTGAGRPRRRGW